MGWGGAVSSAQLQSRRRNMTLGILCALSFGLGMFAFKIKDAFSSEVSAPTSSAVVHLPIEVKAKFSPEQDIQGEIVKVLGQATKTVHVQAYLLTDNRISQALIDAYKRGVQVQVLLDEKRTWESSYTDAQHMQEAGIDIKLETAYTNAHNKIILVDANTPRAVLITGSYNFTVTAQRKNAENILLIRNDPQTIKLYLNQWQVHHKAAISFDSQRPPAANNKRYNTSTAE